MLVENNSTTKKINLNFMSVFEAADIGMSIVNKDGYFVDVNKVFCELYEYRKEEIVGRHFTMMLSSEGAKKAIEAHVGFFDDPSVFQGEFELLKNNGEKFLAEVTARLIYDEEGNAYRATTISDITERKYNELLQSVLLEISQEAGYTESLSELFSHIHELIGKLMNVENFYIALFDKENGIINFPYIVDTQEPDVKEAEMDISEGKSITTHILEIGETLLLKNEDISKLLSEEGMLQVGILPKVYIGAPLKFKNKSIGVVALQSYVDEKLYDDKHKKILEIVANQIARVVERKNFEQQLIAAKKEAEASNRIKSEFLAQMSHEIRTPINSILSFSSLIRNDLESVVSGELRECFDLIERGGKRLIRTIDLILNVAQLQMDKYEVDLVEVDLANDIISPLISQFEKFAEQKGVKLSFINDTDYSRIVCDYYSVNQLFINLIDNAIKYTPKGNVTLEMRKNEDDNLIVDVIDTGIGISKEFQSEIFEIFTQEDTGYTRKFEGTGLGLSLVKQYAELNNAKITVESKKGFGSKFSVTFS